METGNSIPVVKREQQPLISVIVPAYNLEPYIGNCLDSLLAQTYPQIEIIVIDDGSTDRTAVILDDYANKWTRIRVKHVMNGGVTNARMTGVEMASGAWIGFVDGDDEVEPDMYERLIKNALENYADISHCGYQTIVNGGERIHYFYNTGKQMVLDHDDGLEQLIAGTIIEPSVWNKLYSASLFKKLNMEEIERSIRINEDLMMNYLLFDLSRKSVFEDFCPYHYLTRSSSATRAEFKIHKVMDPVKVKGWIVNRVPESLKETAEKKYMIVTANSYAYLFRIRGFRKEKKLLRKLLTEYRGKWRILGTAWMLRVAMITYFPHVYSVIYGIYEKFLQKKQYE